MSFYPDGYDPRSRLAGFLRLANINTPDGDFGFIIGQDGVFTDTTGKEWVGSQVISEGSQQQAVNGVAPSGAVTLAFFQDPNAPDLIEEIKALGLDYIKGREIQFYFQPLGEVSEFYAPKFAPILEMTRIMSSISYKYTGALERSITLNYESVFEARNAARRLVYSTAGHAALIGEANVSLRYMPTSSYQEQSLFG